MFFLLFIQFLSLERALETLLRCEGVAICSICTNHLNPLSSFSLMGSCLNDIVAGYFGACFCACVSVRWRSRSWYYYNHWLISCDASLQISLFVASFFFCCISFCVWLTECSCVCNYPFWKPSPAAAIHGNLNRGKVHNWYRDEAGGMDDAIHKGRHDPFGFYDRQTHKIVRKLSCLEENILLAISWRFVKTRTLVPIGLSRTSHGRYLYSARNGELSTGQQLSA